MKDTSLFIATPTMEYSVTARYTMSLIVLTQKLTENDMAWDYHVSNGSLVTHSRNSCVKSFLETDKTHLLFVDSDISFDPEDVMKMLEADKDILAGVYYKKTFPLKAVVDLLDDGIKLDKTGWVEVNRAGTGLMLIKRSVFETLLANNAVEEYRHADQMYSDFFKTTISEDGSFISEDYNFCDLWTKHGGKIFVSANAKVIHTGAYAFGSQEIKVIE